MSDSNETVRICLLENVLNEDCGKLHEKRLLDWPNLAESRDM